MQTRTDQDHFLTLLENHYRILYKIANSYCSDPSDREDLIQEMSLQLWRSFSRFDDRRRFSTWMYRVALNVAISFCRRRARWSDSTVSDGSCPLEIATPGMTQTSGDDFGLFAELPAATQRAGKSSRHSLPERTATRLNWGVSRHIQEPCRHEAHIESNKSSEVVGWLFGPRGHDMGLDDRQQAWKACDRNLDAAPRLIRKMLRDFLFSRSMTALNRLLLLLLAEFVAALGAALWLGSFLWEHLSEPRLLVPGVFLHLFAITLVIACIHQILAIAQVDYGVPTVVVQKRLESLRIERIRMIKWASPWYPLSGLRFAW